MAAGVIDPKGFNMLKQCRSGPMLFNKQDWPIGMSLARYGEFSWHEMAVFHKLVKPDHLVIEAGANIGTHTLELSKLASFVIAFEPQRIAFQTMCANLMLNHRTNVKAMNMAVGKEDKIILVPVRDQYVMNNFGGVILTGVTEGEPCEQMRLDRFEYQRLDFIKADIEGMEADMLLGAEHSIAKHRPVMYMEADGAQKDEAIRILFDWKYDCFWHFPRMFNPDNIAGDAENMFAVDGKDLVSVNILCFPAEINTVCDLNRVRSPDEVGLTTSNEQLRQQREAVLA